jgi:hypothetical protein
MFRIYNTILRRHPEDVFKRFESGDNTFATTIHILVSAVVKLTRKMKLPPGIELYRGLGGRMELPESFCKVERNGVGTC